MSEIELTFFGSRYCKKVSHGIIPYHMSRGRTTIPATRFVGGLLNNGRHLFWHQLQPILAIGALHVQNRILFTFIPYRLYSNEQGGFIDGIYLRHKGHKYGLNGGRARVHLYQPKPKFGRKINLSCVPWDLYFIYQFEDIYAVFVLEERLYIPYWLLPIVHTPR